MAARKKPNTDHVVLVENGIACTHCGTREAWAMPMRIDLLTYAGKSFAKLHARCTPRENPVASPTTLGEWYRSAYCGVSAATIAHVLGHGPLLGGRGDAPYDPSDFARCRKLVGMFPGWRERLDEVGARFPIWRPMVRAWDELVALYDEEAPSGTCPRLYARIKQLRTDVRDCDVGGP